MAQNLRILIQRLEWSSKYSIFWISWGVSEVPYSDLDMCYQFFMTWVIIYRNLASRFSSVIVLGFTWELWRHLPFANALGFLWFLKFSGGPLWIVGIGLELGFLSSTLTLICWSLLFLWEKMVLWTRESYETVLWEYLGYFWSPISWVKLPFLVEKR